MIGNDNNSLGSAKLTPKQQKALDVLLTEPTVTKAAKLAKLSEVTLYRWLNEPVFAAAYRAARGRLLENTLTALQAASTQAVETLRNTLTEVSAPAQVKVSAARSILEFALKGREALEFVERLVAVEEVLKVKRRK